MRAAITQPMAATTSAPLTQPSVAWWVTTQVCTLPCQL